MSSLAHLRLGKPLGGLPEALYSRVEPQPLSNPHLVSLSSEAARLLDLEPNRLSPDELTATFAGGDLPAGWQPLASVYAGHQFGGYTPQLGDGRALLLGEYRNRVGECWEVQLKGSGKTPYSRHGDGRAVLRSCIREFLASEAMAALNVPTTRALCVLGSDTPVMRDGIESAALMVRLSPSHLRFGHFEYLYYSKQREQLPPLADWLISRFYPEVAGAKDRYAALFEQILLRTARLAAQWQAVGFCHGVLNTDNMSLLGLTLDYGPFGFLDRYDPGFTPNSSDTAGRYAFANQPRIVLWNCVALAQAFTALTGREALEAALAQYEPTYQRHYAALMAERFGLPYAGEGPQARQTVGLIRDLLQLLESAAADYNLSLRALVDAREVDSPGPLQAAIADRESELADWFRRYRAHQSTPSLARMDAANPRLILRSYLAQQAIEAAERGCFEPVDDLLRALRTPFAEPADGDRHYIERPPHEGCNLNLSCSS
ncbi:protein adenylyltransferase SelO [Marinobacterium arenosum]|uniref:protein adenylyltransferase SelO n=1 Tax=Marinobacterium arenosum TaxID=2862496 RepID=UPI001C9676F8|nr:YdiU family protein [Marinobacterium arenosum]MBY4676937.1 YdiU family protein [Marinobacterium arenosum]